MKDVTIKTKVIALLVISLSILAIITTTFSVREAKNALMEQNYSMLTASRDSKVAQLENFFNERTGDIRVLARSADVAKLIEDFNTITENTNHNSSFPVSTQEVRDIIAKEDNFFINYMKDYGYYDVFLINKYGQVVYSASKESDFGANLKTGTLKDSGLAHAFNGAVAKNNPFYYDMAPYAPSNNEPAMFLATPVGNTGYILAFQISDKSINKIVQFREGYGKTQEDYLVGPDKLMRSDSYLNPTKYSLKASFAQNNKIDTKSSNAALKGDSNTEIVIDYNGNPVLSAYESVKVGDDFTWAMLSEIDEAEVLATPDMIRNSIILISMVVLIIVIIVAVIAINAILVKRLKEFQTGLIEFFCYINKETNVAKELKADCDDEIGIMAKAVNENIVKTRKSIEEDHALIEDVKKVVGQVKSGCLNTSIKETTQNENLQELKTIINEMILIMEKKIHNDINELTDVLNKFKAKDFRARIQNPKGDVAVTLNELSIAINQLLRDNFNNGTKLNENAKILNKNVEQLSFSSNQQAASLEETAAALEEITSTIKHTSSNVAEINKYTLQLNESINQGQKLADQTTSAMEEINEQTQLIAEAITVIDQIAFQTNILSLNAAVEAATAGEAGKGFAVVAQEVRNLASRSADAAREIKDIVENATSKANIGKEISASMIQGYEDIAQKIKQASELINQITTASREQASGITQINDAVSQLDKATQENANIANNTSTVANQTSKMAIAIVDKANESKFN